MSPVAPVGHEVLRPLPLFAVALFALNNLILKASAGGWWTGKLSDFAACFFVPLYLSALLQVLRPRWTIRRRVTIGAALTAAAMVALQTWPAASALHDALLIPLVAAAGLTPSRNVVDPTDLIALPMCAAAVAYARCLFTPWRLPP